MFKKISLLSAFTLSILNSGFAATTAEMFRKNMDAALQKGISLKSLDERAVFEKAAPGENSISVVYVVDLNSSELAGSAPNDPPKRFKPYGSIGASFGLPHANMDATLTTKFLVLEATASAGIGIKDSWKLPNADGEVSGGMLSYAARLRLMEGSIEVGVRGQSLLLSENVNPEYSKQYKDWGYDVRLNLYAFDTDPGYSSSKRIYIVVSGLKANSNVPSLVRLGIQFDLK